MLTQTIFLFSLSVVTNFENNAQSSLLLAAGAYQPEAGYDSLNLSMPAYNVESIEDLAKTDSLAIPAQPADKAKQSSEKKEAARKASAKSLEERASLVAQKKAEKKAEREAIQRIAAEKAAARAAERAERAQAKAQSQEQE